MGVSESGRNSQKSVDCVRQKFSKVCRLYRPSVDCIFEYPRVQYTCVHMYVTILGGVLGVMILGAIYMRTYVCDSARVC